MRYEFADLSLDTDARQLRRGGSPLRLSPKAMDLLSMLVSEPHRVVPKTELYDRLWPGVFVVEGNLYVLIREIRRAIGDRKRSIIKTAHRTGYSCAISVREVSPTGRAESEEPSGVVHTLRHGNQEYRLKEGENLVGREPTAQLFLSSNSVSRRHAVIDVSGDRATLTDLGSKNGTFIGDQPVRDKALLADGTIVRFGSVEVLYQFCFHAGPTETLSRP
jgi:DNA-binding winged helix-turn-helix (wHTH) protein